MRDHVLSPRGERTQKTARGFAPRPQRLCRFLSGKPAVTRLPEPTKKGRRPGLGESMEYQDHIARVLAYIETNLTAELRWPPWPGWPDIPSTIFCGCSRRCAVSPADCIRKRRLSRSRARQRTAPPISSIAFAYGFNSKENFTRAFKTEHCVSPRHIGPPETA